MEINDYPNYLIYDDGRVYNKKRKIFMKCSTNGNGYIFVRLSKNNKSKGFYIHRLVALHYIDNPENKPEVDHINHNTFDNTLDNLQWLTHQENLDKRTTISNTGEKYINISTYKIKNNTYKYYNIEKKKCFRKILSLKKYTLDDAINLRDSLLLIDS